MSKSQNYDKLARQLLLFKYSNSSDLNKIIKANLIYDRAIRFSQFYDEASKVFDDYDKDIANTEYNISGIILAELRDNLRRKELVDIFPYWQLKFMGGNNQNFASVILPANDKVWDVISYKLGEHIHTSISTLMQHEVVDVDFCKMKIEAQRIVDGCSDFIKFRTGFMLSRSAVKKVLASK